MEEGGIAGGISVEGVQCIDTYRYRKKEVIYVMCAVLSMFESQQETGMVEQFIRNFHSKDFPIF